MPFTQGLNWTKYLVWRDNSPTPELVRSYLSEEDFIKSLNLENIQHIRISYRKDQSKPIYPKKPLLVTKPFPSSHKSPF